MCWPVAVWVNPRWSQLMYLSKQLPHNPPAAAGGGKCSAGGVILCLSLTVTILISSSIETMKAQNWNRARKWNNPSARPQTHQSATEMRVKHAEGKEIILLHSGTSFGSKWGTAMRSWLFPLHGAHRHSWLEKALQHHLPSSCLHPEAGEWGSKRAFHCGNSH